MCENKNINKVEASEEIDKNKEIPEEFMELLATYIRLAGPHMTVTQRAKAVKQPRGGYIKRVEFDEVSLGAGDEVLNEYENVHASLMGMAIDYLTRFILTGDREDAFKISLLGSEKIKKKRTANKLLRGVTGLDDKSIANAIKLSGFDVLYRAGRMGYVPVEEIKPDQATIENVRIMVERTLNFIEKYGPITKEGFTFEGAYTKVISTGDADYLTEDTLWDLKVLKNYFTKNHTMQLFIYRRMGLRSDYETFKKIKKLGIYNPRKNKAFTYDLSKLSQETIRIVDEEVIGYGKPALIYK